MKQKLAWAEEFGATHVGGRLERRTRSRACTRISGTGGVDFAFEVVGTQKTMEQALLSTHRGGTCVVVGVSPAGTRLSIDPACCCSSACSPGTSFGGGHQRTDVPMLIDLFMDGKYQLNELVSRRLPLAELNHAFDLMKQGEVKRSVDRLRIVGGPERAPTRPALRAPAEPWRFANVQSCGGPSRAPHVIRRPRPCAAS